MEKLVKISRTNYNDDYFFDQILHQRMLSLIHMLENRELDRNPRACILMKHTKNVYFELKIGYFLLQLDHSASVSFIIIISTKVCAEISRVIIYLILIQFVGLKLFRSNVQGGTTANIALFSISVHTFLEILSTNALGKSKD